MQMVDVIYKRLSFSVKTSIFETLNSWTLSIGENVLIWFHFSLIDPFVFTKSNLGSAFAQLT